MDRSQSVVTPERFAKGMTFDEYVKFAGTPENLEREAGWALGTQRKDLSGLLRGWYEHVGLSAAQTAAIRWLAAQPNGPDKILAISEDWSSDCRRDVPMLAHLAGAAGMELRIFVRDGKKVGRGPKADPADSPNADIVNEFLHEREGQTYQSIPVAVFYTKDLQYLYHYTTRPKIYHADRLAGVMRAARAGESQEQTWDRFMGEWRALQRSPFFPMWASAAVDEMLSALHERIVVGSFA
jgi:hypothetical protein